MFESENDRLAFLDVNEHAVSATYTVEGYPHPSAKTVTIKGQFDEEHAVYENIAGSRPTFFVRSSDVSEDIFNHVLTISGNDYLVKEWEPDGTGWTRLILEQQ